MGIKEFLGKMAGFVRGERSYKLVILDGQRIFDRSWYDRNSFGYVPNVGERVSATLFNLGGSGDVSFEVTSVDTGTLKRRPIVFADNGTREYL